MENKLIQAVNTAIYLMNNIIESIRNPRINGVEEGAVNDFHVNQDDQDDEVNRHRINNLENKMNTINEEMKLYNENKSEENAKDTLLRLCRNPLLYINPIFDTDEELIESYWNYYPDEFISSFGSMAAKFCIDLGYNQYLIFCPDGFNYNDHTEYSWTRDDVRMFLENVPIQLFSLEAGY
jgi:hypothetical protein